MRAWWREQRRPLDIWFAPQVARAELAQGLSLDRTRRTADGGRVTVLTVDPKRMQVEAGFIDGVRAISPNQVRKAPGLLAALNGTFFGFGAQEGTYGDLLGQQAAYRDEELSPNYDAISDKRWFLARATDGSVSFGRGGLREQQATRGDMTGFIGGMGRLYGPDELATLPRDVASGAFWSRIRSAVADRSFPNTDLTSAIPRTVVGRRADGQLLLVSIGEGKERGLGANFAEAAMLMRSLGAVEAYTLDGGGSTHLIAPGVLETQTDGRVVKSYLYVKPVIQG
ncbi:MAG: phosphodiester glycosidase family protein [Candidatus Sericytochromatia bacterium]|nr:phosphodiester glycosidase family protein [Candidatus Sericytochromatia bacterium]